MIIFGILIPTIAGILNLAGGIIAVTNFGSLNSVRAA